MDSLAAGLAMGRLPVHRPSKSLDRNYCVSKFLSVQDDTCSSDWALQKSSTSLSWLPSAKPRCLRRPAMMRSEPKLRRISTLPPPLLARPSLSSPRCSCEYHAYHVSRPQLALDEPAGATFSAVSVEMSDQQSAEQWSANVRQLIQETERSFEAVGDALHEAHLASQLVEVRGPAAPSPVVPMRPSTPPRSPSSSINERREKGLFQAKAPARKASLKGRKKPRFGGLRPRTTQRMLAEKLGTGQRRRRLAADEMTPSALSQALQSSSVTAADAKLVLDRRPSTDSRRSMVTDESISPVEPFHLEGLMSRVDAPAERALPAFVEHPNEPWTATVDNDVEATKAEDELKETDDFQIDDFAFPVPPQSPVRHGSRTHQARLPTIPEVLVAVSHGTPPPTHLQGADENDQSIYLRSLPFSSANRSFRHGPITLPRPETCDDEAATQDETVDWAAFQMAILGGAGDLVSGMYEDDQNEMADEVVEWFETFGFETHGRLIPRDRVTLQDSSHSMVSSSPSTINSDTGLPIPVESERPSFPECGVVADTTKFSRHGRGQQKPYPAGYWMRPRAAPLVVGDEAPEQVSERVVETAPMACNMEHDLGEFLRWEAEHVYGGFF